MYRARPLREAKSASGLAKSDMLHAKGVNLQKGILVILRWFFLLYLHHVVFSYAYICDRSSHHTGPFH